jgi:hypothetical protein
MAANPAIRFPLVGRDILILASARDGILRRNIVPVPASCTSGILERYKAMGIIQRAGHGAYRVTPPELAAACAATSLEIPDADDVLLGPTSLAILAALPDVGGPPNPWEGAAVCQHSHSHAASRMHDAGILVRRRRRYQWAEGWPALKALVQQYRRLYARPIGTPSLCIHQRGVEAAWTRTDRLPSDADGLVYRGPRNLDRLDQLLLRTRAAHGLLWDAAPSQATKWCPAPGLGELLDLDALVAPEVCRRFEYYGLTALLPALRSPMYARLNAPGFATPAEATVEPLARPMPSEGVVDC